MTDSIRARETIVRFAAYVLAPFKQHADLVAQLRALDVPNMDGGPGFQIVIRNLPDGDLIDTTTWFGVSPEFLKYRIAAVSDNQFDATKHLAFLAFLIPLDVKTGEVVHHPTNEVTSVTLPKWME